MIYIERELERKIRKLLDAPEIIAVLGARQVGKTTLMKRIFDTIDDTKIFLDFEDPEIAGLFDEDIKTFAKLYVKNHNFVFLDEFQYSKNGGRNLKFLYDTYKKKFLVSGSSSLELTVKLPAFLVGRIFILELFPFTLKEFFAFRAPEEFEISKEKALRMEPVPSFVHEKLLKLLEEFVIYGGFPRVVTAMETDEKKLVLKNLITTYLLKDIRGFFRLSSEYPFNRFMKALSLQIGNLLNYSELSNITGISLREVKKYFSILEETYIIKLSKPFYRNKRTEIVKNPKVYFLDNGLRNATINDFRDPSERVDTGQLLENLIASELVKYGLELRFWRTKGGAEVDFVIEKDGKLIPIEVKSSTRCTPGKSLISFSKKYGCESAYVFYKGNLKVIERESTNFIFLPAYLAGVLEELL